MSKTQNRKPNGKFAKAENKTPTTKDTPKEEPENCCHCHCHVVAVVPRDDYVSFKEATQEFFEHCVFYVGEFARYRALDNGSTLKHMFSCEIEDCLKRLTPKLRELVKILD